MPNYDQTGPRGAGPQTGRGFGPCTDNGDRGFPRRWFRGFCGQARFPRWGFGRRFGWRQAQTQKDYAANLANYRQSLEEELATVKAEEAELTDKTTDSKTEK